MSSPAVLRIRHVEIGTVSVVFLASALLKLVSGSAENTAMGLFPGLGSAIAIAELALVGALLWRPSRFAASLAGLAVFLFGAAYALLRPQLSLPSCGCFGSAVDVGTEWHLLICGVGIFALSGLALRDVCAAPGGGRGR